MGSIGFTQAFISTSPNAENLLGNDEMETLSYEVLDIIQQFLRSEFDSDVALEFLEDIEEVIEISCGEGNTFEFQFIDHWYLGAEIAYHWYELALLSSSCRAAINQYLGQSGLALFPLEDKLQIHLHSLENDILFVELQDELIGIESQAEPGDWIQTEGRELELSDEESQYIEELRLLKLCHCPLCLSWRESE